jgi:hypothetical protein
MADETANPEPTIGTEPVVEIYNSPESNIFVEIHNDVEPL